MRALFAPLLLLICAQIPLWAQSLSEAALIEALCQGVKDPNRTRLYLDKWPSESKLSIEALLAKNDLDSQSHDCKIGVIDAIGRLKINKGIDFLLKNIAIGRAIYPTVWEKGREAILKQFPAVQALVSFGDEATAAIEEIDSTAINSTERIYFIFTMSEIATPRTRLWLTVMQRIAQLEAKIANEGLTKLVKN